MLTWSGVFFAYKYITFNNKGGNIMKDTFFYALTVIRETVKDGICHVVKKLKMNINEWCDRKRYGKDSADFKKYQ